MHSNTVRKQVVAYHRFNWTDNKANEPKHQPEKAKKNVEHKRLPSVERVTIFIHPHSLFRSLAFFQ